MPPWAIIAIVVGGILLLASSVFGGVLAWRAYVRRVLLRLLAKMEGVEAAAQGLIDTMARLAEADDEELAHFSTDPESTERHALHEVEGKARMLAEEVDTMPLPRSLVSIAEWVGDAAWLTAGEAGKVAGEHVGTEALDDLTTIDLESVRAYTSQARIKLITACEEHGLSETAVYGGGLYL